MSRVADAIVEGLLDLPCVPGNKEAAAETAPDAFQISRIDGLPAEGRKDAAPLLIPIEASQPLRYAVCLPKIVALHQMTL